MIDDSYSETCSCEEEKPAKLSDPPCCAKCPFCRRQIKLECFEVHTKRCGEACIFTLELRVRAATRPILPEY